MAGKLICRICGAEYEGCRTAKHNSGQFRWQDVACCPEHGRIYFDRILASRMKSVHSSDNSEDEVFDATASKRHSYSAKKARAVISEVDILGNSDTAEAEDERE